MHLKTFRRPEREGINPYMVECKHPEHCSWVHHDKEKATAKASIWSHVSKCPDHALDPSASRDPPGVSFAPAAGIQPRGHLPTPLQVIVVEREPSIGGKMAAFPDFPTLDCSSVSSPAHVEWASTPTSLYTLSQSRTSTATGHFQ